MVQQPLVSIVVPTYNAAPYIGRTLRSALAQTFAGFELIVVDDCSTDATGAIVAEIAKADDRVRLISLDYNRGAPAGPRNIAIRAARGEWIAFLDADDIWHPEKLACQLEALRETGASFCSTQSLNFTDESQLRLSARTASQIERVGFWKQMVNFRTPTSSVVARRSLLLRHPFNEDLRYKAREDLDCWLHCMEETRDSIKLRSPMMGYRIIAGQISGSKGRMFKRHFFVLSRYRFRSGRGLGPGAFLFTLSHFLFALHSRLRGGL